MKMSADFEIRPARVEETVTGVELSGDDLLGFKNTVAVVIQQDAGLDTVARRAL